MKKKEELLNEIESINNIFLNLKHSYLVLKELYKEDSSSDYIISIKRNNTFLLFIKVNFWRILCLEIIKLFSIKERYNVVKLINKFKKRGCFYNLNLDQIYIEEILSKIESKETIIDNIKDQRDKIYAHMDSNGINIENITSLECIFELIEIVEELLYKINNDIFKRYIDTNLYNPPIDGLCSILNNLDSYENFRIKEHEDFINKLSC